MRKFINTLKINKVQFRFSETLYFPVFIYSFYNAQKVLPFVGRVRILLYLKNFCGPGQQTRCEFCKRLQSSAQPALTHLRPNLPTCQELLSPQRMWFANSWWMLLSESLVFEHFLWALLALKSSGFLKVEYYWYPYFTDEKTGYLASSARILPQVT